MASKSASIFGIKVRTSSERRYVLYTVRPWDVTVNDGGESNATYVSFAQIEKRSDNWNTIRAHAAKQGCNVGSRIVIWDTALNTFHSYTGMEIDVTVAPAKPSEVRVGGRILPVVERSAAPAPSFGPNVTVAVNGPEVTIKLSQLQARDLASCVLQSQSPTRHNDAMVTLARLITEATC